MKFTKSKDSENRIIIVLEEPDDLFSFRRVTEIGDNLIADTTRVLKQDKEHARPDKGERVKIRVVLRVEKVGFDGAIDRLKISGTIVNSNNENVPKGLHHSINVRIGDTIILEKSDWNESYIKILTRSTLEFKYILVSIDSQEASIARLIGTNLKITPNIYSGRSGKRYHSDQKNDLSSRSYFESIRTGLDSYLEDNALKMVVFGPGETKRKLINYLKEKNEFYQKIDVSIVEGIEASGEDGIFVFLRSQSMRDMMLDSKMGTVSNILDNIMKQVSKGERKFAMGFKDISYAHSINAVDSIVYSDKVFAEVDEAEFIKFLNDLENKNVKIFATDSTTDMGLRVSSLSGVVALLRYQIN